MNLSTGRKTALLTGAAGRLGTAIIELIDADIDIIALVHKKELNAPSSNVSEYDVVAKTRRNSSLRTIKCDLTSEHDLKSKLSVISTLAPINYVVNAAGDLRFLGPSTDVIQFVEAARLQMELHVFGPALICSVLFHEQWKHIPIVDQDVSIVNVSSISGSKPYIGTGQSFYAASKAAINMLTLYMASEYGKYGIKVNAVCPDSFPSRCTTASVAEGVMKSLTGIATGHLFKI